MSRKIELPVNGDFSEAMIEAAFQELKAQDPERKIWYGTLTVSVFNVMKAVEFMVRQDRDFEWITEVRVSPYYEMYEWRFEANAFFNNEAVYVHSKA